jgi:hypothetical protein
MNPLVRGLAVALPVSPMLWLLIVAAVWWLL